MLAACAPCQRFRPIQDHGVWWLQGPNAEKVFSFGVCVVEPGTSWNDYDLNNPSYAGFKFYPNRPLWAKDTVSRLQGWTFNTIGAWSDYDALLAVPDNRMYLTPINHMGSSAGFPWLDMWDPANVKICDDVCKGQVDALKKDKRIVGYFSDNELGWWRSALFKWVWDQKTHGTRQHVVELLQQRYATWDKFNQDFEAVDAKSFGELRNQGKVFMRPGSKGIQAVEAVLSLLAHRYYSLCHDIIKKYDPDALYLGDRYISNYYPEVAEQAGKDCDVVSTNLNPNWTDGGYVRFHLDGLEKLTHKPLMITEYYMTAKENRSGNGNDRSGFPVVQTQAQRAKGFTNTTLNFAHDPNLVGAHWFQYYDEPKNGRGDGENYDFGLVDTANAPYEEVTKAAQNMNVSKAHEAAAPRKAPQGGLPTLPAQGSDLAFWNRDQAFVPPLTEIPRGDMYAAWGSGGLTLAFYWYEDLFAEQLYKDGKVPVQDRSTVEISIPGTNTHWLVRLNDKGVDVIQGPKWPIEIKVEPSCHLIVTIPPSAFKSAHLRPNQRVSLDAKIVSECRAYITHWHLDRFLSS